MTFLTIEQILEKYPFVFKSKKNAVLSIARNRNNIRSVALKIRNQTFFEEEKLLEWIRSQTYEKKIRNQFNQTNKNETQN